MLAHRLRQGNFAPAMAAPLLVEIRQPMSAMPPTRPQKGSWETMRIAYRQLMGTTSGWIAACITRAVLVRWEFGRTHVIGKLERRSSQPPAFLGHLVAWYHPVGIRCLVFVSSPTGAPCLVVIIGKVSGTGTGVLYIARNRAYSWPRSLIWHLCEV